MHFWISGLITRAGDRKEAADFIRQFFSVSDETTDEIYDSIIADPSNYLLYYTGYLEIERMRAEAEEARGVHSMLWNSIHFFWISDRLLLL